VGIWKSRKNEIFHFAIYNNFDGLVDSVEAYAHACYTLNYRFRFVSGEMLARGELEDIKLLILPSPYYFTENEAQALIDWVQAGGVLLSEAHLAGYNATTGRHNRILPGCGLSDAFGLREADSTSSYHLKLSTAKSYLGSATEDVKKALAEFGTSGGLYFPIRLASGNLAWGAARYAQLVGEGCTVEGAFEAGADCLVSRLVGKGKVFYCGTNLGQGAKKNPAGLMELLAKAAASAGVAPTLNASGSDQVHVDALWDDQALRFLVLNNRSKDALTLRLEGSGTAHGLFSKIVYDLSRPVSLPGEFIDLFVVL
jgi:hypothetical protein